MTNLTHLLKLHTFYLATWLLLIHATITPAADLTFTPATPVVTINQTITLSVAGASGQIRWGTLDGGGKILGEGNQVTYLAPDTVGKDVVTAMDSEGKNGLVTVVITPANDFSLENAQWEVFTKDGIGAVSLSEDGKTLWVGRGPNLEQRDTDTGEIKRIFTKGDGLPHNKKVTALLNDGQGGLWIGTACYDMGMLGDGCVGGGGLAHYSAQGQWQVFNQEKSDLPDYAEGGLQYVTGLQSDGQGGLWIETRYGGDVHYSVQGLWSVVLNYDESPPDNYACIRCYRDGQGGLWMGYGVGSLIYYSAQGQKRVFNHENSGLPDSYVSVLLGDGQGGLWIGTSGGGLAHYNTQGQWRVFNQETSDLPSNQVSVLQSDGQGGLWISSTLCVESGECIGGGLAHYNNAQDQWQVFNLGDHGLPDDDITGLQNDGQGGVWVGTAAGGLAHYSAQGQWQIFNNEEKPRLPPENQWPVGVVSEDSPNFFSVSLSDNQGGNWIGSYYDMLGGTERGSLVHVSAKGQTQKFTRENSGLPSNDVTGLQSDGHGGLWISTTNGTAHLTFGRQTELCTQTQIDSATCQAIQQGQHAAIIVAAGGAQDTNTLWESTEAITTRLYRTFYRRGFDKSHLYYLSPKTWADFSGDGRNDSINRIKADRNLTLDDLQAAFTWAKGLGKLDQPLYFFFMDHGGEGKLQLSPDLNITAEQLKTLLDDYQTTGNSLIAVIEACHSGSLIPTLTAPNRAVIASAKDSEFAYFFEKKGFSRFLADYLLKGASFWESFTLAGRDQEKLLGKNRNLQTAGGAGQSSQTPQLDDNQDGTFTTTDGQWLKRVYINGSFTTADATLAVTNQTPATTLTVGQALTLQAKVTLTQGTVNRVWAVIRPPAIAQILDTNGTPILAFPRLELGHTKDNPELWQGTWNEAVYNGNYLITFYAQDNEKNIASSEQDTVLTVTGGIDPPAQAQVQIHLEKDRYQRGEPFKVSLTEELGWGYDLYAAVLLPDKQTFLTLKETNGLRPVNEAKPWYAPRKPHSPLTLLDLTVPATLPTGEYCLFGILSPAQEDVFETAKQNLWVTDTKCVEVVP